ncbi:NAD(P)/FAD-dependent oxidoreductase [Megalodesulfovibrio gigas]|uniref:Putative oxidoreductase n=1 Tax=Megalodesulfovibrio gigas (strain ATCC 19364 / DSM 1382 / NCIMB 9332 / VKM B-1759) TaxID=1121448 RepID=T2G7C2_MEGG1|nr:FAD-dependent oxidoreductase [Megalodesulfovibrio gigas]AGW12074.1 putative oxidoreductase [Megalodesulfovibrio gigas DSM 1382 = ATCC 19364]
MKKPVIHDAVVIGAGAAGCAVAQALTLAGADVCVVEAGADILAAGASKGDPGILRSGFDLPLQGRSLACVRKGRAVFAAIKDRFQLPLLATRALVPAATPEQAASLPNLLEQALAAGATASLVDGPAVQALEPGLTPGALGALLVEDEAVVDPWSTPLALAWQASLHGADFRFLTAVKDGQREDGVWVLHTSRGTVRGRVVVNCAGMQADVVEALRQSGAFHQTPRKEQYLCFAKNAARLLKHIVLPFPGFGDVAVFPSIFGNVMAGPYTTTVKDRGNAETAAKQLTRLERLAAARLPALAGEEVLAGYARVRPANLSEELLFEVDTDAGWITIAGIATLGLAGALGVAAMAAEAVAEHFKPARPVANPQWPVVPMLAEHLHRPWQQRTPGDIVCHCERVTQAEIEATFASPLPPGDLHGLKRRTRAGMGLCQGDGCAHVTTMLAGLAKPPLRVKPPYASLEKTPRKKA